jgi:NADPH:quinone reductase-like Zn-dependent oxidoreductase
MKAAVLVQVGQPLELMDVAEPSAEPGQAVVDLNAATLNRRDYWITRGQYPGIRCPVVLGSKGTFGTKYLVLEHECTLQ